MPTEAGFLSPEFACGKKKNPRIVCNNFQLAKTVYSTGTRTRARENAIIIQNILFLVASGIAVLAYGHPRPALAMGA
jgi:hypothetical protein